MHRYFALPLTLLLLVSTGAQSQTLKYNIGEPLRFGAGYNTLTGTYAGVCTVDVKDEEIQPAGEPALQPGQLTKWELTSVEDLTSLSRKLDVSASASASFVAGSASASVQYMDSKAFNSYHQFLYLDASVANATKIWTKPRLEKQWEQLRQSNPLAFLARCGDTFVKTITSGGALTAILDLSTSAQEDTSSLAVAISGNYGTVEGRAALHDQLQKTVTNRQTKVTVVRAGGTGSLPSYSAEDLIAASLTFPAVAEKQPYPMLAQLASYDTIASPVSLTTTQDAYIRPLFNAYRAAMQYLGDLTYVRAHTSEFRTLSRPPEPGMASAQGPASQATPVDVQSFKLEALTSSSKQRVVDDNFVFNNIDKDELANLISTYEGYSDSLANLARTCLSNPKTGCKAAAPQAPAKMRALVRVFPDARNWDTKAGPVSIVLDSTSMCKVDAISGTWKPGDGRTLDCAGLPKTVTNGYIITGGFDSYYPDNVGVCTWLLTCFRR